MATFKDTYLLIDKVTKPLQKIQENLRKTTDRANKLQEKFNKLGAKLQPIGAKMQGVTTKLSKSFGILAGVAVTATAVGVKSVANYADNIDDMSKRIGISTRAFQEWDYIMSQNGGNVESLQMGFKTLTTQIEGVQKGSKDSIRAFRDLGVNVKDSKGQFRSLDDIFNDSIKKLQQIENPTKKAMLANRLFGRSATELRPLLELEAKALDELRDRANNWGLILSDEEIQNAAEFADTLNAMGKFFNVKMSKLLTPLLPVLNKLFVSLPNYFAEVTKKVTPAMQALRAEFDKFATENPEFINALKVSFDWILNTGLPKLIEGLAFVARVVIKIFSGISKFFAGLGGLIGNIVGWIITIPDRIYIAFQEVVLKLLDILLPLIKFFQNVRQEFLKTGKEGETIAGNLSKKMNKSSDKASKVDNSQHNSNNSSVVNNNVKQFFAGWGNPRMASLTASTL